MNIFETIARVSSRIEPYHSQFLADSLEYSLQVYQSFFDSVWKLAAPSDWEIPINATVSSEEVVDEDQRRRIDICIRSETPHKRVLGIEVKTNEGSVTRGQLRKYRADLKEKFGEYDVEVAYLTPFNEQVGNVANSLPTIREFKKFSSVFPRSRHFSWIDVADIPWNGNELWKQHRAYVKQHISSPSSLKELRAKIKLNRELPDLFGEEPADRFFAKLYELGISGAEINLSEFRCDPSFATSLVDALETLLDSPNVSQDENKDDEFSDELRRRFLESEFRQIHEVIFNLSKQFNFVWIRGKYNYGVRTAHRKYRGGVSLLTSAGPERLLIRLKR